MRRAALFGIMYALLGMFMWLGPPVWGAPEEPPILKAGSQGVEVYEVQDWLFLLGFLKDLPGGQFGNATLNAVLAFQGSHGLTSDGVVGPSTWSALRREAQAEVCGGYTFKEGDTLEVVARRFSTDVQTIISLNRLGPGAPVVGQKLSLPPRNVDPIRNAFEIELVDWTEASGIYADGSIARVIDVASGRSFLARRRGGHYHADSEPLTPADTRIMKEIFGGTWTWDRRAIIVEARGHWLAASMNGMPHGGEEVSSNGFAGHFCVHFLGSKTHGTAKVDPAHQQMVFRAAAFGR